MTAEVITRAEFEQLYRDTAPQLFAYVRRRSTVDPEDVVAEVFITAWRRRTDLPGPTLRRAWLYGTARNILLADGRCRRRTQAAMRDFADLTDPTDAVVPNPESLIVRAALDRLSRQEREIILLTEWEQLSPAEAAAALGIKPGTARVRLHRARQALATDPELAALLVEGPNAPAVVLELGFTRSAAAGGGCH